jgi:exodeoxyribonuclease-3
VSRFSVASWNVNSLRVRLGHVLDWLREARPALLCLQETKVVDADFPYAALEAAGYRAVCSGQKTYNGVATLVRDDLAFGDASTVLTGGADEARRFLALSVAGVRVLNLYVPNGSEVGSDKYAYKLDWLGVLERRVAEERTRHARLVLAGDFNIAPADADVHDPQAWRGKILCSDAERAAFRALLAGGLVDLFRQRHPDSVEFSWWDYRMHGFRRNHGLRIDHLLVSDALAACALDCRIDRAPRALERPSDHAPVVATFELAGPD